MHAEWQQREGMNIGRWYAAAVYDGKPAAIAAAIFTSCSSTDEMAINAVPAAAAVNINIILAAVQCRWFNVSLVMKVFGLQFRREH